MKKNVQDCYKNFLNSLGIEIVWGIVASGGVSERPKERASKARVGETQPWVQIPPPPQIN